MQNISEKVNNFDFFHCIERQGYIFTSIVEPANVLDAIVIRNPEDCQAWTPKKAFSEHSLKEHIEVINQYKLEKATIIAENIDFIVQCPSLKYLEIIPADTAPEQFDYSPLYKMLEIKYLSCRTAYGGFREPLSTSVDYSKINGLQELDISGTGNQNYNQIESLERLQISASKITDFSDFNRCRALKRVDLIETGIKTLQGIGHFQNLQQLNISYERRLCDVTEIEKVAGSLRALYIEKCPKLVDFSFLAQLQNLEHLKLYGENELPNLSFLNRMHKLKTFIFSVRIQDGDLTPCLSVPYVWSMKNRKGYNLKDKELPKELMTEPFKIW